MITSLIWLMLLEAGKINPDNAPWLIYIPVCIVEIVVYVISLPKICEWLSGRN